MAGLNLNNYDNNYQPEYINYAYADYYNYEQGEVFDDPAGRRWTVNIVRNDSAFKLVEIKTIGTRVSDFTDGTLEAVGFSNIGGLIDANILNGSYSGQSYGKATSNYGQPYMTLNSRIGAGLRPLAFTIGNQTFDYYAGYDPDNSGVLCPFCFIETNTGEVRYGGFGIFYTDAGYRNTVITLLMCKFLDGETWGVLDVDPGQTGFVPTGAHTTHQKPGIGGRGSSNKKDPDYASDTVTQPDRPNESQASAVKSGFLKSYLMTQAQLDKICSALYSETLLDVIKSSFVNPLDFIVSLMVFPTNPDVGATENLRFGKWIASAAAGVIGALGVDITGSRLSSEFKKIDFGTLQIPENWGNFLDYSQTSIELYLPFIGSVNIDVAECMGGSINVQYTIDFFTGMCVANVLCERSFPLPSGKFIPNRAQHAYQGNCAIQIPLSAANYGSMVGSLINACTQGISNPAAGFAGIASDAIAGGLRPNISSKGNIVANSGFCSVLYPYVRITRPITAEPDSYQEVMGYPSYINTSLGQCEDLCICDEIDLKGITGATEEELNRIRQMCKDGVYV